MPANELGQPVGAPVPGWSGTAPVVPVRLTGRTCRLEPLGPEHADPLYAALVRDSGPGLWTYLPYGPFEDRDTFAAHLAAMVEDPGLVALAVCGADGTALGVAAWLRSEPAHGSVEVGHLAFSSALQRTTAATEALVLMARHVFEDLGVRRYEWKCHDLNAPSRRAALRLGFVYEGTFRQALVVKARNRDTAWFSIIDAEWPRVRAAYAAWLDPANFAPDGAQRTPLAARTVE